MDLRGYEIVGLEDRINDNDQHGFEVKGKASNGRAEDESAWICKNMISTGMDVGEREDKWAQIWKNISTKMNMRGI